MATENTEPQKSNVVLKIEPELAIVDEQVHIKISNLIPFAPVTVNVQALHYGNLYCSIGHFFADQHGCLEPAKATSHGGTYVGKKKMGLFTSILPMFSKNAGTRMIVKSNAEEIMTFDVAVWKGHLTMDAVHGYFLNEVLYRSKIPGMDILEQNYRPKQWYGTEKIAEGVSHRTYLCKDRVQRIPIDVDYKGYVICGTLFVPFGKGPFPGIIDLFGGIGGCVEMRAALYAKQGYASFALAYMNYKRLPYKNPGEWPMKFFDVVVDWMLEHPRVCKGGVGMSGVSMGSQISILTAVRNPKVIATICINANHMMYADPSCEGNPHGVMTKADIAVFPEKGYSHCRDGRMIAPIPQESLKLNRKLLTTQHDNPILFLIGENEARVTSNALSDDLIDWMKRSGKKNMSKVVVKGEGHLIEPPYMPMCWESRDGVPETMRSERAQNQGDWVSKATNIIFNGVQYWGGDPLDHEEHQIFAWKVMLDFFEKNLRQKVGIKAKL